MLSSQRQEEAEPTQHQHLQTSPVSLSSRHIALKCSFPPCVHAESLQVSLQDDVHVLFCRSCGRVPGAVAAVRRAAAGSRHRAAGPGDRHADVQKRRRLKEASSEGPRLLSS